MKTVKEVSRLTGVSIRTLHHYDTIGLLKPSRVTEAGYRLYDDQALERLSMILLFREFGLGLREIGSILDAPDYHRNRALERQIRLMEEKTGKLQNRIGLAKSILVTGGKYMDMENFDYKEMDNYSQQAKTLYGKTDAYKEFQQKSAKRTREQEKSLGNQVMDFFVQLGKLRPCQPDSPEAFGAGEHPHTFQQVGFALSVLSGNDRQRGVGLQLQPVQVAVLFDL